MRYVGIVYLPLVKQIPEPYRPTTDDAQAQIIASVVGVEMRVFETRIWQQDDHTLAVEMNRGVASMYLAPRRLQALHISAQPEMARVAVYMGGNVCDLAQAIGHKDMWIRCISQGEAERLSDELRKQRQSDEALAALKAKPHE